MGNQTAIINHKCFKYTGQSGFQYFTSVVLLIAFAEAHVNITHIKKYIYMLYMWNYFISSHFKSNMSVPWPNVY